MKDFIDGPMHCKFHSQSHFVCPSSMFNYVTHKIITVHIIHSNHTNFIVLFLGITKALMSTLSCFMKHYGHGATFENFINPFLQDIASFRLEYCVMKKIPDTLWVSENYVGMARIFPWAFGLYCI